MLVSVEIICFTDLSDLVATIMFGAYLVAFMGTLRLLGLHLPFMDEDVGHIFQKYPGLVMFTVILNLAVAETIRRNL